MKIGLLSDTHSYLHPHIFEHFKDVDQIWHAGDMGDFKIIDQLEAFKATRAVYGNIDSGEMQKRYPEYQYFKINQVRFLMMHIGGYPPRYNQRSKELLNYYKTDIFICGHSHILKVVPDAKRNLLHLNPGACGKYGWHKVKTIMRFEVLENKIDKLEVIELGKE